LEEIRLQGIVLGECRKGAYYTRVWIGCFEMKRNTRLYNVEGGMCRNSLIRFTVLAGISSAKSFGFIEKEPPSNFDFFPRDLGQRHLGTSTTVILPL
jgi:hypothetical protein